jgi:citrate lyase subunit beta/citryl-CoA lyase
VPHSFLYVPADRPDRAAKAFGLSGGAAPGAVILDLEDGVAPSAKDGARAELPGILGDRPAGGCAVWVRIGGDGSPETDLEVVAGLDVDGVILPKATSAALTVAVQMLSSLGRSLPVAPLIESARGLLDAPAMAAHPAVRRLAIGEADLTADLGLHPSAGDPELVPLRLQVVVASAAAGIGAPTGPVSTEFRDLDALRVSTEALRSQGFGSRSAIHPSQVPVINEVFTPAEDELARARELLDAYDTAMARGEGAFVGPDGRMVDEAVVRSARHLLSG